MTGTPPKVTFSPGRRLLPVMMTESPPVVDPVAGETRFSFGAVDTTGAMKVKALGSVPVSPALLSTVTPVVPPTCGGLFAVIVVLFTTTIVVAVANPKLTVAPVAKLLPVIVTAVPPLESPDVGVIELTVAPVPGVLAAVVKDQT